MPFVDLHYISMSRLAKKPISLPSTVTLTKKDSQLIFKGQKGEKILSILPFTEIKIENQSVKVSTSNLSKQGRANSGTMWSLMRNAIQGLVGGFSKKLEIEGVGYRAALEGETLVLSLGYVNPVRLHIPQGLEVAVEKNAIKISGIDKELVGRFAAEVRAKKKPEPYKGKGIRYEGEIIKIKAGKKATGSTGAIG